MTFQQEIDLVAYVVKKKYCRQEDKQLFLIAVKNIIEEYKIKPSIKTLCSYAEMNDKKTRQKIKRFLKNNVEIKQGNKYNTDFCRFSNGILKRIPFHSKTAINYIDKILI